MRNLIIILVSIIIFLAVLSEGHILKKKKQSELTSTALYDVVEELFILKNIPFEIVIFGDVSLRVGDKIDILTKKIQEHQSIKIM